MRNEALEEIMKYAQNRRAEYAWIASHATKRGMEAKQLSAECHELAYFDIIKAIERIQAGGKP